MSCINELEMMSNAYFLKGMIDDLLSVSIWYSREKISEDSISLQVYLPLGVRYGFRLPGLVYVGGLLMMAPLV